MSDIIVNLEGDAEEALKDLDKQLQNVSAATSSLTSTAAKLTVIQQQQTTIIQKQSADWKYLAAVSVPAISSVIVETERLAGQLVKVAYGGEESAYEIGTMVVGSLLKMAETTVKCTLATKGVVSVIGALKGKTKEAADANQAHEASLVSAALKASALGVAITTLTGKWGSASEAAAAFGGVAAKTVTGLTLPISGAKAGLSAFSALLERTGKKTDIEVVALKSQTEAQAHAFEELKQQALATGKNIAELTGEISALKLEMTYGVKQEEVFFYNLDRLRPPLNGLKGDLAAVGKELGNVAANTAVAFGAGAAKLAWDATPIGLLALGAKQLGVNLNPLPAIWKEIDRSATATTDQMIDNLNRVRSVLNGGTSELQEFHQRMDEMREAQAAGWQAIRGVNEEILKSADARAKATKDAAREEQLATIKTIAGIDAEIQKLRQKASEQVLAGKATSDSERSFADEVKLIEERRTAIIRAETEKRKAIGREYTDFMKQLATDQASRQKAEDDKRYAENTAFLQKLKEAKLKSQKDEDEQWVRLIADINDFGEKRRADDLEDQKRKAAQAVEIARQAAAQQIAIEQQKQAALKAARQQVLAKAGVNGQDVLNDLAPQNKVKQQYIDQAKKDAQEQTRLANLNLLNSGDDNAALYARLQRKAQQNAVQQATKDFNKGQADPQKLAQAQQQVAARQLGALQQNGQLNGETVQALADLIKATTDEQVATQSLQKQVEHMQQVINQLKGKAQQQRKQAQQGSIQ